MNSKIFTLSVLLCRSVVAWPQEPQKVVDPFPGSGGLFLGTPSAERIASGSIDFTTKRFDSFKVGTTTKAEVVKILGKPAGWMSDPDGKSQLEYDYIEAPGSLGMRRVMYTFFTFNSAMVLTRISYPGYDSKIVPITFNNVPYVGRSAGGEYRYTPKPYSIGTFEPELLTISVTQLNKPDGPNSLEAVKAKLIERCQRKGRILAPLGEDDANNRICAVLEYPGYSEFVLGKFLQAGTKVVGIVYSYRINKKGTVTQIDSWVQLNRVAIEKQITDFKLSSINNLLED